MTKRNNMCTCNPKKKQVCPECSPDEKSCWRCGGAGWVNLYNSALHPTVIVHESDCKMMVVNYRNADPMEEWTEEDLAHIEDALALLTEDALGMPGLEWIREKIKARIVGSGFRKGEERERDE